MKLRRRLGFIIDVFVIWASGAMSCDYAWREAYRKLRTVELPEARLLRIP